MDMRLAYQHAGGGAQAMQAGGMHGAGSAADAQQQLEQYGHHDGDVDAFAHDVAAAHDVAYDIRTGGDALAGVHPTMSAFEEAALAEGHNHELTDSAGLDDALARFFEASGAKQVRLAYEVATRLLR